MTPIEFFELLKANGPEGLFLGLVILLAVYLLKFSGLVKTGNWARVANVILAVLLGGVKLGDTQEAFVAAIAAIVAALIHEGLEFLPKLIAPKK